MHPQNRFVGFGADEKARGYKHLVILGLAVDVLDAIDRLHDGFERLGHKPCRVLRLQAIRPNLDIDHRHGNLWLFLARQLHKRDTTKHQSRKQKKRRQRGSDERLCQIS